MKMKHLIGVMSMCAIALTTGATQAAIVRFTITGDYSASWDLASPGTPSDYLNGSGSVFWTVAGSFGGAVQPAADLTFFNASAGGGLNIYDFQGSHNLLAADGPQLYTGFESAPTFKLGTFALTEFRGAGHYTITVAEVASIPEPATLALTLSGLGWLHLTRKRVGLHAAANS